ncbi:3-hydroxybutyrate dehydrogenase type 2-like [Actinia tenebrosa]|uniref:Dehydrogenase/reductase SDR family member 6 n=1 Tax=Actinia tenebrosa TaxID=6105 RepID=A0A6P8HG57_ACTTE|nr:3-hydroxybutyrate dehydrogenase type 2-like [Actinia tenebrosa]
MASTKTEGKLSGKTVLITAAAQGIGHASAIKCAEEGAKVIATDINAEKLKELEIHPGNIQTSVLDVTDDEAIKKLVSGLESIDVLFNCAGIVFGGNILECTEKEWDLTFDVNVKSMFRLTKEVLPKMLEKGSGSIINMSSAASSVMGVPNRFSYSASKGAVIGFTKALAADFITKGIRCNAICPCTIHTPSLQSRIDSAPDPKKALEGYISRQAMGRFGKPEEVASLVVFLASDDSSLITGQDIRIDGGWMLSK